MLILTIVALVLMLVVALNQLIGGGDGRHMFFINTGPLLTAVLGAAAGLFFGLGMGWTILAVVGIAVVGGVAGNVFGQLGSSMGERRLL